MDCLRVAPSQLHPKAWAFVKVFQLYGENKSCKPSLELFFNLFSMARTFHDDVWNQGLVFLPLGVLVHPFYH